MSLPAPATCTPRVNTTFANTARVSERLETNVILPLKNGDTIELDGYRQTGEKDVITVSYQFDDTDFVNNFVYIYVGDRAGTVVSVQEAHTTPSPISDSELTLWRNRGLILAPVLTTPLDLNTPSNTVQNGNVNLSFNDLIPDDSLGLEFTGLNITGLKGAVVTVTIELD